MSKSKSAPTLQDKAPKRGAFALPFPIVTGDKAAGMLGSLALEPEGDPRGWLIENSEQLVAQTEKCLVVHRQLHHLLLDTGAKGHGPSAAQAAVSGSGQEPQGAASSSAAAADGSSFAASSSACSSTNGPEASADSTLRSATLASLNWRKTKLRSELTLANEELWQLKDELASAHAASDQFQEAVDGSCEMELQRLDSEARQLEEHIAARMQLLRQHQASPASVSSASASASSALGVRVRSAPHAAPAAASNRRALQARGPVLGRAVHSPARRPLGGPPMRHSSTPVRPVPSSSAGRPLPRASTPGSSPRRFTPVARSAAVSGAAQLRTPPRSCQPGVAPAPAPTASSLASSPASPKTSRQAGGLTVGSQRASSGSAAGGRWVGNSSAALQLSALNAAATTLHSPRAGGGVTAASGSIATSAATAAAASAAVAQVARNASPAAVVQSLQRLETARCQAQADFWAH